MMARCSYHVTEYCVSFLVSCFKISHSIVIWSMRGYSYTSKEKVIWLIKTSTIDSLIIIQCFFHTTPVIDVDGCMNRSLMLYSHFHGSHFSFFADARNAKLSGLPFHEQQDGTLHDQPAVVILPPWTEPGQDGTVGLPWRTCPSPCQRATEEG